MTSTRDGSIDYHPTHPLSQARAEIDDAVDHGSGRERTVRRRWAPHRYTVVYDETCALCRRAREWLVTQPSHVELELLAAGSLEAQRRYHHLPWLGQELVVVDEQGRTWIGPAAFLVCIWSTRRYRIWAFRLSEPTFAPMAERFFHLISAKRTRIGAMVTSPSCTYCNRPTSAA